MATRSNKSPERVVPRRRRATRGTYALLILVPRPLTLKVGRLRRFKFPVGYYVYIGSAMRGLDARIARHCRLKKRLFWHIDYLLAQARVLEVWTNRTGSRLECSWAESALSLPNARVVVPRFGSSDCRCGAHLIFLAGPGSHH